jgi:hypothetical protein
MVGALGSHPLGGHSGLAEPLPLAFPLPHRSNPGRTTLPHVELQRRDGDGGRVVAAACFRRLEQEPSKSNSSRIGTPFGGYKLSGFGGRDNGLEALEQYTELKPFGSPSTLSELARLCRRSPRWSWSARPSAMIIRGGG